MRTVFAVRGPDGLWFARRIADLGIDSWTADVTEACFFDNPWSAQEMAVALCARNNGDFYSVYELYRQRRQLGRRW